MHVNDAGNGNLSENVCIVEQVNSEGHLYTELEFIFVFL